MWRRSGIALIAALVFASCSRQDVGPEPVRIAVAASAAGVTRELAAQFDALPDGAPVEVSIGSTGGLYAQIRNGAQFDLFFAADAERPRLLAEEGRSRAVRTYAFGRLALVGDHERVVNEFDFDPSVPHDEGDLLLVSILEAPHVEHVAIANPATAPYGAAAVQVLEQLDLFESFEPRLVRGTDVAQAHHFVVTGAAEVGFVSLAQARARKDEVHFEIPSDLHDELRQDVVLLSGGAAARAFYDFLGSPAARAVLEDAGFRVPSGD